MNLLDLSKPKQSTRKRLLKSAESLFAKRGFGGLTLREVSQQSNTNLAAAHYHFGSKEALVMEMLQCRIRPINERRRQYLANAKAKSEGKALSSHLIFEALIAPIGEEISKSIHNRKTLAQIVARSFTEPESFIQEMHRRFFGELCELFIHELCLAHPDTPKEDICWNLHFAISSMLGALAQHRRLHHFSQGRCDENDTSSMISRLILFVTHGFEAGIKSQNP